MFLASCVATLIAYANFFYAPAGYTNYSQQRRMPSPTPESQKAVTEGGMRKIKDLPDSYRASRGLNGGHVDSRPANSTAPLPSGPRNGPHSRSTNEFPEPSLRSTTYPRREPPSGPAAHGQQPGSQNRRDGRRFNDTRGDRPQEQLRESIGGSDNRRRSFGDDRAPIDKDEPVPTRPRAMNTRTGLPPSPVETRPPVNYSSTPSKAPLTGKSSASSGLIIG